MNRNHFSAKSIILIYLMCLFSMGMPAQNINPDTQNFKQLNQNYVKADKMKTAGIILTFSGLGIVASGYLASVIWLSSNSLEGWEVLQTLIPFYYGALVGIPASIAGITLWAIGGIRKSKAEVGLMKFDPVPGNSMALGVKIRIRF